MTNAKTEALNWTRDERIVLPSSEREYRISVRVQDFARIKRGISSIKVKGRWLPAISSSLLGAAISHGSSAFTVHAAQGLQPWVEPLYWILFSVFSIGSVILYVLHRSLGNDTKDQVQSVLKDIEDIESMFPESKKKPYTARL